MQRGTLTSIMSTKLHINKLGNLHVDTKFANFSRTVWHTAVFLSVPETSCWIWKTLQHYFFLNILYLAKRSGVIKEATEWKPIITYIVESFPKMMTFFG